MPRPKGDSGFDYPCLCPARDSTHNLVATITSCITVCYRVKRMNNKFRFWHTVCNVCRMQRALRPRPVQPTPAGAIRQEGNRAATGRLRSRLRTFRKRSETRARKAGEEQKKNGRTREEQKKNTGEGTEPVTRYRRIEKATNGNNGDQPTGPHNGCIEIPRQTKNQRTRGREKAVPKLEHRARSEMTAPKEV